MSQDSDAATTSIQSFPTAKLADLKRLKLFQEIPATKLSLMDGKVRQAKVPQGETIIELATSDEAFRYFFFITKGQVKAVGLDEEARVKPLNFLRKGEFFVDKSFHWRSQVATKMVALTDVELLIIPREDLRYVAKEHSPLTDRIKALSERIDYRNRIYSEDNYAKQVLEFLIENELTQASRVKITQLDKCIECNTCYKSCEDRHGFQRLERGYARFGVLDFAKSCLTCFYPTCIPACPVDSVVFNTKKAEVEILDSCIGCQACARACQYGAIRMFKVEEKDDRFARFLHADKKIKPKFVADKCNHCDGHDDMACISNCPTGAIIEVSAQDLLENPRIFGAGEGVSRPLPSLLKRSWLDMFAQRLEILIGFVATFWMAWEAYALNHARSLSPLVILQSSGVIPAEVGLTFARGSDYCYWLGNIGFTLIFLGMTYPLRKGMPKLFKYLGKQPLWLDFHNFCGIMGTIFVIFHTGFAFPLQKSTVPGIVGILFLLGVTASGIFGRFLYAMIPRGVAGTELKMQEVEEEDAAISAKLDALFEGSVKHKEFINKVVSALTTQVGATPSLGGMVKSFIQTYWLLLTARFRVPREMKMTQRQAEVFFELLHDKIRLKRNAAFLSVSSRLFMVWRFIHRPFAYIMVFFAVLHVIYYLVFFGGIGT